MTAPIVFHTSREPVNRAELIDLGIFSARVKQRRRDQPPVPGELWDRLADRG